MDLNELKELLQILEEKQIAEFELEESGMKLRIRKAAASHNHASPPSVAPAAAGPRPADAGTLNSTTASSPAGEAAPEEAGLVVVKSPIVGTFYRAADPGSPPFVSVGDNVAVGQVLCIIEAMKLMNEIEAEVAGEIAKIHPENAQPVQYGEPLFSIRPAR